jgi:uncharacterized protein YukE
MAMKTLADLPTPKRVEAAPKEVKEVKAVVADVEKVERRFDTIDKAAAYFRGRIEDISKNTLQTCWEIGTEVNLIKDKAIYGKSTVENFAEKLATVELGQLYRYAQFAATYSEKDLKGLLTKKHLGWGAINKLLSIKDPEKRKELEDKLDKGEIKASELEEEIQEVKEEISKTSSGKKGESARSYTRNFQKMNGVLEALTDVLPKAAKDMRDLDEIADDEDKYEKVLEAIADVRTTLDAIWDDLSDFKDKATKLE